jgi:hypothetical protein
MKDTYRTTIILDKELRRKIRIYQVDHDDSMKQIIFKSLNEYFRTEKQKKKNPTR